MKRNYLNKTKTGLKALLAGLFLFGTLITTAQCNANFTFVTGPNGSVSFVSTSTGTTISTNYSWNFAGSGTGSGTAPTHTYSTNGFKWVCLTIISNTTAPNSCTSTVCDSVLITNATTPTTTPCGANFSYVVGPNGSVSFVSTSTGTTISTYYSWNFGGSSTGNGTAPTHTYTTNGYKQVCLTIISNTTSPTSCTSTACDSVLITNVSTPTTTPCNAGFNYVLGANGSVNFASTSTGTSVSTNYSWSFGGSAYGSGTTPSHTYTTNGIKWVCLTITNSVTSCSSTICDSLLITNISGSVTPCTPSVVYTLSKDSTMALTWNAYPYYPSNITNATWYWGDGSSTTGLYPSHTYSAAGTYSTCVTISVSCSSSITATYCYVASIFRSSQSNDMILVNVKQALATGIKNLAKAEGSLNIYPNPNNGEFVLELNTGNDSKENTISVYNIMGEKVLEKNGLANGKQTIDVSSLANGTYLVKVNSDAGYLHKKITIQK